MRLPKAVFLRTEAEEYFVRGVLQPHSLTRVRPCRAYNKRTIKSGSELQFVYNISFNSQFFKLLPALYSMVKYCVCLGLCNLTGKM